MSEGDGGLAYHLMRGCWEMAWVQGFLGSLDADSPLVAPLLEAVEASRRHLLAVANLLNVVVPTLEADLEPAPEPEPDEVTGERYTSSSLDMLPEGYRRE